MKRGTIKQFSEEGTTEEVVKAVTTLRRERKYMFNELESKYEGMVDGVYEGWFIVLYQDETKARVMWSSMKDEENRVSIVIEDWEKFADGAWGVFNVVEDSLGYEYTKEKDIYYYNNFSKVYCEIVKEEN